ncbi:Glycosyltransferase AglI [uncultured archaeon]|nr:Glycosyltransferase AglI [uncultured archaeon]
MVKQKSKKGLVSLIIINYNGGRVTLECIESILKQDYKKIEIIVSDNGSKDDSIQQIKKRFPKVLILELGENKGYAGGINEGLKRSSGEYIIVMNNDLILRKNTITEIIKRKEEADIFGVKNYYVSRPDTLWATGVKLNRLIMKAKLVGTMEKDVGQYDKTNFEHLVGSFLFIKRKVFDKIGGFDEDIFCYYEETEFQERARRNGFRILFVPKATLLHHVAYSSGGGSNVTTDYYLVRNRGKFIRKYQVWYLKPVAYSSLLVETILRPIKQIAKFKFRGSLNSWRGFFDFLKGIGGRKNF